MLKQTDRQAGAEMVIRQAPTEVVGALIVRNGVVLCAQRGSGKQLAGYWEFPGGKVEAGESLKEALTREIREELECSVTVGRELGDSLYAYDFGSIHLTVFQCSLSDPGQGPHRTEHQELRWMRPAQMLSLTWAPADLDLVSRISQMTFTE
ncbi:MAG: (deoxy)nucleoside triphosphate pyrophosphohydrolase [Actinomycetaceae bacterium]|nr:(deoxy)nucleoside triphosphate pyrophosphohydrolase [Actinomycetaceae bacterium]MDY6082422.1 (deoxy)nucleoside triphosphate pyrophosphohydrolase [Actinomycetaceae bacterium]